MDITNNTKNMQFEYRVGDDLAHLDYRYHNDSIALMHTVVPEAFKGKGIASALAQAAFAFAKASNKPVMVYCQFIAAYLKKHPELNDQLDPEFHK